MIYKDFEEYWRETFGRRSGAIPVKLGSTIKAFAREAWDYQQQKFDKLSTDKEWLEKVLNKMNSECKELKARMEGLEK